MSRSRRVLVVEDDPAVRRMVEDILSEAEIETVSAGTPAEALTHVHEQDFDAVLSDVRMPGMTGIELVREILAARPHAAVVLMTAFASIDSAVESMRAGALDYITKPFKPSSLLIALQRVFERSDLERENERLRDALDRNVTFGDLIGSSTAMREIFSMIRRVADKTSSVLITGESGTGKEKVAQTIHFSGNRGSRPFVPINCTAIPEGLLESELFGHLRGAFTGAVESKKGLFEIANGGSVFLDEIGDMGLDLQGKLLRVLEEQEIRAVGDTQSTKVDVRIIAATNRDLQADLDEGRFRRDLYFRLNVIHIHIPPLRERPEDIESLVRFFVEKLSPDQEVTISKEALLKLESMPWPGNIRELSNVIERALALGNGRSIDLRDLPDETASRFAMEPDTRSFVRDALSRGWTLKKIEDAVISEALQAAKGNKARTAELLGISRRTLYRRGDPD